MGATAAGLAGPHRRPASSWMPRAALVVAIVLGAVALPGVAGQRPGVGGSAPKLTHDEWRKSSWLGGPDGQLPPVYPKAHSGNVVGRTGVPPDPLPVAAVGKTALQFDGADDFALVRTFNGLPLQNITAAGWVRVARHKSYNRIMSHEWVGWGWNLYVDGSGVARFGLGQDNKDFAAGKIIFRDKWHFVVGTYDGAHISIYVDGIAGSRIPLPNAGLDSDGFLSIGGAEWDPFHGELDDLRLYNRALTQAEVRRSMSVQPSGDEPGLVGYWRLDEGGGHTVFDLTANRNHATLGSGRRAPAWVASGAQVAVPCAVRGHSLSLVLEGMSKTGRETAAYVTALPPAGRGKLLQPSGSGGFDEIETTPTEVRNRSRRLVYQPPPEGDAGKAGGGEGGGGGGAECVVFEYRTHDGEHASATPGRMMVDLVGAEEECAVRPMGERSCWGQRTHIEYILPRVAPPTISVIVPLYNSGGDLPETLATVFNQTFKDFEVIIADDGSTDNSNEVAREMIRKYGGLAPMRLVEKPNGGLADARNAAIRVARGDWIFPLDSDDLITDDLFEQSLALAAEDNTTNLVIADLKGFGAWEYSWKLPEYDALDLRYTNMFHCSAMYRKSLWEAVPGGYPPTTLFGYEDWAFWIYAETLHGVRPKYIHEEKFFYRIRSTSMHQTLLKYQEYSLASIRMLNPTMYPAELLVSAHDKFLLDASEKVVELVRGKAEKFPHHPVALLMRGMLREGSGTDIYHGTYWEDALGDYETAATYAATYDWQPRWRKGLILQRMGRYIEGNATLAGLFAEFSGLEDAYYSLPMTSLQEVRRGPVIRDPDLVG